MAGEIGSGIRQSVSVWQGIPVKTRTDMHMRLLFQQKMQRAHGAAVYTEPGAATAG